MDEMFIQTIIDKHHKHNTRVFDALIQAGDGDAEKDEERWLTNAISGLSLEIFPNEADGDEPVDKIAIIRDWDDLSKNERVTRVNSAINNSGLILTNKVSITQQKPATVKIKQGKRSQNVEFSCFFIGVKDPTGLEKGETDDLLKLIASKPSPVANCAFECLEKCLRDKNIKPTFLKKYLSKLWIYNYLRFDDPSKDMSAKIKNYRFTIKDIYNKFNDLFDLESKSGELQKLIKYIDEVAQ